MKTYNIKITDTLSVDLTAYQFTKLHDELTTFYNANYAELTKDEDESEESRTLEVKCVCHGN